MSVDCKSTCKMAEDVCLKEIFEAIFSRRSLCTTKSLQATWCLNTDLPFYPQTFISIPNLHVISCFQQSLLYYEMSFILRQKSECIVFSGVGYSWIVWTAENFHVSGATTKNHQSLVSLWWQCTNILNESNKLSGLVPGLQFLLKSYLWREWKNEFSNKWKN